MAGDKTKDFLGVGWGFPVALRGGKVALAAGEEDVRQSIQIILGTALGERVMEPTFGSALKELVFDPTNASAPQLAIHYVREALQLWEPRIQVDDVQAAPDPKNPSCLLISIGYTVRARNQRRNLVYPFYLTG